MKKLMLVVFAGMSLVWLSGCGGSEAGKLIGTWKVEKVETDFDESRVTPEMLSQVVEMQKQTHFRILNDSAMVIISNLDTHEAQWKLNPEDKIITYFFSGMEGVPNELGKVSGNQIISESKTAMGMMTITYTKE